MARRSLFRPQSPADYLLDVLVFIVMVVVVVSVVFPFYAMLIDSFSTSAFAKKSGFKIWPRPFTLDPYAEVFSQSIVGIAYVNTTVRTITGTMLSLVVCFGAAYAISKVRMPFAKSLTVFMVFTMFFNGGLIPTYLWFKQLGLLNTRFVLIFPHIAVAYYIVIMRNFFMAVPDDLEESAIIDGASVYTILFRIIVPISTPVIATVALWSVVAFWNEWFQAMLFAPRRNLMVLQLLLRRILIENNMSSAMDVVQVDDTVIAEKSIKAATMFVAIGPIILIYPFVQKYFVKGIMTGAVKG